VLRPRQDSFARAARAWRSACLAAVTVLAACGAPASTPIHDVVPRNAAPPREPPLTVDAARTQLDRARAAWESGDRSPTVIASFEAAGRALRRHGVHMRPFVAMSSENARTTTDGRVHLPITDHSGEWHALAVFAVEDAAKARLARRAPALLPRNIALRPLAGFETSVAPDGAIVATSQIGAWLFPSIDRPPLAYPAGARATLDGRALLMHGAYGVDAAPRSYEAPRLLAPDLFAMGPVLFDLRASAHRARRAG
jgi:hypothetical protein